MGEISIAVHCPIIESRAFFHALCSKKSIAVGTILVYFLGGFCVKLNIFIPGKSQRQQSRKPKPLQYFSTEHERFMHLSEKIISTGIFPDFLVTSPYNHLNMKSLDIRWPLVFTSLLLAILSTSCNDDDDSNNDADDPTITFYEFNRAVTASGTTIGVGKELEVDLDRDGINDVVMTAFYSYFAGKSYRGINGTQLFVPSDTASFFVAGSLISSTSQLALDNTVYANAVDAGFVGFRFDKSDGIHYGWFKAGGNATINEPFVSVTANIQGAAIKVPVDEGIEAGKY
jgi:hypothetical protein